MGDPLVSTAWLAEHLGDPDVLVLDASWFLPAEGRSGREEYLQAHIPGAAFFDIDAVSDHATDLPHMLPTPEVFAQAAGELGLRRDATIVAYDSFGIRAAARLWWTLRAMAYDRVFVLDGGLRKWTAEGRPTQPGEEALPPAEVAPGTDPGLVRSADEVRTALDDGAFQLVDARPAARFRGEAAEPRPGLASGHMPGAKNLPFNELLAEDGAMRSAPEVRARFEAAGLDLEKPIVATCGSGVTASVLVLGLARIGVPRAAVYDGSWSEWGALPGAPVATGA